MNKIKKQIKKQKLAGEFATALKNHKAQVIMYALVTNNVEDVFNFKYLKRYEDMEVIAIKGYEDEFDYVLTKAYRINEDLEKRTVNGETELYDKVYNYCWNKIKHIITDDYSFSSEN